MATRTSAGILLFRPARTGGSRSCSPIPGGPFFTEPRRRLLDDPEGRGRPATRSSSPSPGGSSRRRPAIRRPTATRSPLGSIVQKGGKVVHAWALEGDLDPATAVSNTFEMTWPPGSGRRQSFPEIDRVEWFDADEARRRVKPTQIPLIDRLVEALDSRQLLPELT